LDTQEMLGLPWNFWSYLGLRFTAYPHLISSSLRWYLQLPYSQLKFSKYPPSCRESSCQSSPQIAWNSHMESHWACNIEEVQNMKIFFFYCLFIYSCVCTFFGPSLPPPPDLLPRTWKFSIQYPGWDSWTKQDRALIGGQPYGTLY
jgi:hypothetical protein